MSSSLNHIVHPQQHQRLPQPTALSESTVPHQALVRVKEAFEIIQNELETVAKDNNSHWQVQREEYELQSELKGWIKY